MEISAPSHAPAVTPPKEPQATGRLAALRALQKALEAERRIVEETASLQEGKGQILDLRC